MDGMSETSRKFVTRRRELWSEANMDELLDGMTAMEFMLRFTLSHPHLGTTIVGTANAQHLADNVAVAQRGPLPADLYQAARDRISAVA